MSQTTEPRHRTWAAFAAGAVVMLLIVLVWLAWSRTEDAAGALRADVALPSTVDLPSLPKEPPPQGPHLPRWPTPRPK